MTARLISTKHARKHYIEIFKAMVWLDELSLTDFEYQHLCNAYSEISRVHESLCDRAKDNKGV